MFLNLQTIKSCCIRGTRDLLNAMEERREQARKVKHKGKRFRFNLRSYTKCRPLCLTAQRSQFTYTIYSYLLFSVFVNCMSAHFNPDHPINSLLQALPLSYCIGFSYDGISTFIVHYVYWYNIDAFKTVNCIF